MIHSQKLELLLAHLYTGNAERAWSELDRLYTAEDADTFREEIEETLADPDIFYQDLFHSR